YVARENKELELPSQAILNAGLDADRIRGAQLEQRTLIIVSDRGNARRPQMRIGVLRSCDEPALCPFPRFVRVPAAKSALLGDRQTIEHASWNELDRIGAQYGHGAEIGRRHQCSTERAIPPCITVDET